MAAVREKEAKCILRFSAFPTRTAFTSMSDVDGTQPELPSELTVRNKLFPVTFNVWGLYFGVKYLRINRLVAKRCVCIGFIRTCIEEEGVQTRPGPGWTPCSPAA